MHTILFIKNIGVNKKIAYKNKKIKDLIELSMIFFKNIIVF
jgi:hypothetical protein